MDWIQDLLWGQNVGHSILLLSVVIALGIQLGKVNPTSTLQRKKQYFFT